MKRQQYDDLTPEQLQALRNFASENGRRWKFELNRQWQRAETRGALHQLRNTHGPTWLDKFKLFCGAVHGRYYCNEPKGHEGKHRDTHNGLLLSTWEDEHG